jgi:hypothetical protein
MPYVLCPECGLRTYCVSGEQCPRCGTPLDGLPRSVAPTDEPFAPADAGSGGPIERVLALAREELRMDAAVVSEIRDGCEVVLWAVGNGRLAAGVPGTSERLDDTICRRLLDGTIGNLVTDVRGDPHLRHLPVVRNGPIGAYIAVPLSGGAARRYILCCLAREARPDLGEADVRFLRGLVESVRPRVDERR